MLKKLGLIGMLVGSFAVAQVASAAVIVDSIDVNHKVNNWGSYSYAHDINDNGFTLGSASSATLSISVYDDQRCFFGYCFNDLVPEIVLFTIESFDFDSGGITFGSFNGGLEAEALFALNADGLLNITITSLLGDFWIGESLLTVNTIDAPVDVSAPATVALLGLGVLGLGISRRRSKAKA